MIEGFCIVLDFDGTVVTHAYPRIGKDIGAVPVLKRLVNNGCRLLLSTMRSRDSEGVDTLQPALDWFEKRGIPLFGVNENPTQREWTSSPKVHGNLYIDDGALGAPLKADGNGKACIDWSRAAVYLYYMGLLTDNDILEMVRAGEVKLEIKQEGNVKG